MRHRQRNYRVVKVRKGTATVLYQSPVRDFAARYFERNTAPEKFTSSTAGTWGVYRFEDPKGRVLAEVDGDAVRRKASGTGVAGGGGRHQASGIVPGAFSVRERRDDGDER
jgi:hypothetical protein